MVPSASPPFLSTAGASTATPSDSAAADGAAPSGVAPSGTAVGGTAPGWAVRVLSEAEVAALDALGLARRAAAGREAAGAGGGGGGGGWRGFSTSVPYLPGERAWKLGVRVGCVHVLVWSP